MPPVSTEQGIIRHSSEVKRKLPFESLQIQYKVGPSHMQLELTFFCCCTSFFSISIFLKLDWKYSLKTWVNLPLSLHVEKPKHGSPLHYNRKHCCSQEIKCFPLNSYNNLSLYKPTALWQRGEHELGKLKRCRWKAAGFYCPCKRKFIPYSAG